MVLRAVPGATLAVASTSSPAETYDVDAESGYRHGALPRTGAGVVPAGVAVFDVLAAPPDDPDARPIDLDEFIDDEAARRRFPTLLICP